MDDESDINDLIFYPPYNPQALIYSQMDSYSLKVFDIRNKQLTDADEISTPGQNSHYGLTVKNGSIFTAVNVSAFLTHIKLE